MLHFEVLLFRPSNCISKANEIVFGGTNQWGVERSFE
jgi:hypothetical protein